MLLDVAGLVPGAHQGRGLGNKFLDDLRHADALIHVVDVSGTTDAEGKATRGYDPLKDIEWLQDEIFQWILGNLMERWGSIKRRHTATKSSIVDTLQNQFSGYGSTADVVARALESIQDQKLGPLETWERPQVSIVVKAFMAVKFPTVLALNKIDHPDADKNISKIVRKYPDSKVVLTSAITEVLLRKLEKQGFIKYEPGTEFIDTYEDLGDESGLKPLDEKLKANIERIRDLVLYRFGSTGLVQLLQQSAEVLELVPVFPVKSMAKPDFRDCILIRRGTTVGSVARKIMGDVPIAFIEGMDGNKVADTDVVDIGKNDVLSFRVGARG